MMLIIAIVQPSKVEAVKEAPNDVPTFIRYVGPLKRRRLLLVTGLLAPALAVLVAHWLLTDRHPIPLHTFERLALGMAKGDVNELVGFPPGNYRSDDRLEKAPAWTRRTGVGEEGCILADLKDPMSFRMQRPGRVLDVWKTNGAELYVVYDERDRVRGLYHCTEEPQSRFADLVRRLLGL
jgi:hypothetical protein